MLSKANLAVVVAASAGLPLHEVESACDELIAATLVLGNSEGWDAYDAALLYLRLTAPTVPIERFDLEIASSPFSGAVIDGQILSDPDALQGNCYAKNLMNNSPANILGEHIYSLEAGAPQTIENQTIRFVSVFGSSDGYCLSLHIDRQGGADVFLFGASDLYFSYGSGWATNIPTVALLAIGDALKRPHGLTDCQAQSLSPPASRLVH